MTPIFLGSSKCFHTYDWYESCCNSFSKTYFITDMISSEGFSTKIDRHNILPLILIDFLLSDKYDDNSHKFRNLIKLLLFPFQVLLLNFYYLFFILKFKKPILFAHSSYYAFLASFTFFKYVSTPQGSEILVRPFKSKLYNLMAKRAHSRAFFCTVDSVAMQEIMQSRYNKKTFIVQNGVDIDSINRIKDFNPKKTYDLISFRGCSSNYQIKAILDNKDLVNFKTAFCFPFVDSTYFESLKIDTNNITIHNKLERFDYLKLLSQSFCGISIPVSDSSPRSVYEAIFLGLPVIVTSNKYLASLPPDMMNRIIIADVSEKDWLLKANERASKILESKFTISEESINNFDQSFCFDRVLKVYNLLME